MSLTINVAAVVLLLAVSAFFSSSEIALFSLETHRVGSLASEPGGDSLVRLREDPHRLLVTILVGNNLVNVAIASLTTAVLVERFAGGAGVLLSTAVASAVVLLFGEIVPKSYGVANPERVALRFARPVRAAQVVLYPVVAVFEVVTDCINLVTGGREDIERPYVTREEIVTLVDTAEELGVIAVDEQALIERVFRFNTTSVGSVMVPRADVVSIDVSAAVGDAVDACGDARVSRLPVYEGDLDRVVGYVDVRELVAASPDASLRRLARPALHVFEHREIDEVLAELQESGCELAIVYDQTGRVAGLATTEDIVEQLVGEMFDVGDDASVVVLSPTTASVRGVASSAEVNAALGSRLPESDGTVATLVASELGRPPKPGDVVDVADVRITVRSVEDDRVRRIHVERTIEDRSESSLTGE